MMLHARGREACGALCYGSKVSLRPSQAWKYDAVLPRCMWKLPAVKTHVGMRHDRRGQTHVRTYP